ncbi:hypothetical protein GALMADRAFT_1350372 [Galerina marginata CBS 339.88]|uniref:Uncharacterized protein n=1 Tax=Galerina marginata (strain CBS 339.88) TaxID=685588 RepID=A0A067SS44_GALM3|nr:hypothetical protein GALMADRAFT_1350372 [Galerina marginata CBS 339.88]
MTTWTNEDSLTRGAHARARAPVHTGRPNSTGGAWMGEEYRGPGLVWADEPERRMGGRRFDLARLMAPFDSWCRANAETDMNVEETAPSIRVFRDERAGEWPPATWMGGRRKGSGAGAGVGITAAAARFVHDHSPRMTSVAAGVGPAYYTAAADDDDGVKD